MLEDLLKKFSKEHSFLTKEKLYSMYEVIHDDIEAGKKDNGVWTKAFVDAEGELQKQKAIYISLMVERLILAEAALLEKSRKAARIQKSKPKTKRKSKAQEEAERKKKADDDWDKQFGLKKDDQNKKYETDNRSSNYSFKKDTNASSNHTNFERGTEYKTPKSEDVGLKSYHQKQVDAELEAQRKIKNSNMGWSNQGKSGEGLNQFLVAFGILAISIVIYAILN